MDKQQAARAAADAGTVAAQVINDYGLLSTKATAAMTAANEALDRAEAAGVTNADIRNARRNN